MRNGAGADLAQAVMSAVVVALLQNFVCNIKYSNSLKQ